MNHGPPVPGSSNSPTALTILLWTARIWGTAILAFVSFMLVASLFGEWGVMSGWREWLTFLAFPVSSVVGLGIALKREGLGGLITVAGMLLVFIPRPDLAHEWFFSIGVLGPGILYVLYAALQNWWGQRSVAG